MAQAKVVQSTSSFHYIINVMSYSIPKLVRHNVATLDATNLMLDFYSFTGNLLIALFLCWGELLFWRFLLGLNRRYSLWSIALKPCILPQLAPRWKGILFFISDCFV
jgi:hypothetical protein